MKKIVLILILVHAVAVVQAQVSDYWIVASNGETLQTVHQFRGDSLFKLGQVKQAIHEYRLQNSEKYAMCKYEIACAFAKNLQYDSAFYYLNANLRYDHTHYVLINPDFLPMMGDPRWDALANRWIDSVNKTNPGTIKDVPLAKVLWKMHARDQAYYYELAVIHPSMHDTSALSMTFWRLKEELNQLNHRLLDSIVDAKGWPLISQVGTAACSAAFMVVQHAALENQLKYLPMIRQTCEKGEAEWDFYAHVYDKVCCAQKKPQLYGTQLEYDAKTNSLHFYPIEDEANVNKRREAFGMMPVEEYAEMVGFIYSSPYKDKPKK